MRATRASVSSGVNLRSMKPGKMLDRRFSARWLRQMWSNYPQILSLVETYKPGRRNDANDVVARISFIHRLYRIGDAFLRAPAGYGLGRTPPGAYRGDCRRRQRRTYRPLVRPYPSFLICGVYLLVQRSSNCFSWPTPFESWT